MTIREKKEKLEREQLSPYAAFSSESKGREREIEPCEIRTCFQRDRDRVIHCKAFRRLKHKTQVFLAPSGDHYRTRLTHTLEVSQISRTIASALRLNEDLTEAIALSHDLGHTPFGHAGERALNSKVAFKHSIQSLRIVEKLENGGEGLNLSWEVRDGIINHGLAGRPATLEGNIVRLSDKIAYINHDLDDAIRAGILKEEDVPGHIKEVLGKTRKERLDTLIKNIIVNSMDKDRISMDDHVFKAMMEFRTFMFENVYLNMKCKSQEGKAQAMLLAMFDHFLEAPDELPRDIREQIENKGVSEKRAICDYISGMTDIYAVSVYKDLFVPEFWGR